MCSAWVGLSIFNTNCWHNGLWMSDHNAESKSDGLSFNWMGNVSLTPMPFRVAFSWVCSPALRWLQCNQPASQLLPSTHPCTFKLMMLNVTISSFMHWLLLVHWQNCSQTVLCTMSWQMSWGLWLQRRTILRIDAKATQSLIRNLCWYAQRHEHHSWHICKLVCTWWCKCSQNCAHTPLTIGPMHMLKTLHCNVQKLMWTAYATKLFGLELQSWSCHNFAAVLQTFLQHSPVSP